LIDQLATDWKNKRLGTFEYLPCLSQEPEGSAWQGRRGSCIDYIIEEGVKLSGQAYLCGPPGMIDAGINIFEKNGIRKDAIFFDKFLDKSNQ